MNPNVAAGKRATGGVTVTQANRKRIRASVAAVIAYANAVGDSRSVAQTRRAAQIGAVSIKGEGPNSRFCNRDPSRGVAERE